ncbi:MAG TPA: prepilin-type N-terminal cleavage/methylation domain-containing protein [Fimbriimonas sp.]|nr:prepilin-type N-terminal cleavage/methylation domain-containing protein [Fimbriimonas sp.]
MLRRSRFGFSLLESLAAAALLAVGVTAAMAALSSVSYNEKAARDQEYVDRLASEKYDELISTNQAALANASGDFSDRNIQGYTWNLEVGQSQVTNLDTVTLTVQKQPAGKKDPVGRVEGMMYVPPATSISAAPG